MEINLKDLNFQEIFSAAIIQHLDDNKKDELIKGAIEHLLKPVQGNSYYGKNITPMQEAFYGAMRQKAQEYIASYLETEPTVKETIQGLIKDAVTRIFTVNRDKTVETIAEKIIEGLYRDKY